MAPPSAPRTPSVYFLVVPLIVLSCPALTIGLTYVPCYSGICLAQYYPYETRLHVATFYSFLAVTALFLTVRKLSTRVRWLCEWRLSDAVIPLVGRRLSISGLALLVSWVSLTFLPVIFWLPALDDYWTRRGALVD